MRVVSFANDYKQLLNPKINQTYHILLCQSINQSRNQKLSIYKQHSRGDFALILVKLVLKL